MPILRSFSPGNLVSYLSGASVPNPLKTVALHDKGGAVFDVMAYGATGTGKANVDGAMTSGSAVLATTGGQYTNADVGQPITVRGAGSVGADLTGTIASVESQTSITLSVAAGTTVTNAAYFSGQDDTAALQAALTAAALIGGTLVLPPGGYNVSSTLNLIPGGANLFTFTSIVATKGAAINWIGGSNQSIFYVKGLKNAAIAGVYVQTLNAANVACWDLDTPPGFTSLTDVTFRDCHCRFGYGGSCVGWRGSVGGTTGNDVSFIAFLNCKITGQANTLADVGWFPMRPNDLNWSWFGGSAVHVGKAFSNNSPSTSNGGGSMCFYGFGASGNALDFEFYSLGAYGVYGGRFELGQRFLTLGAGGGSYAASVVIDGVALGGYAPADGILFALNTTGSFTLRDSQIYGATSTPYTSAMITAAGSGTAGRIQVNGGAIHASDPFYTASAKWLIDIGTTVVRTNTGGTTGYFTAHTNHGGNHAPGAVDDLHSFGGHSFLNALETLPRWGATSDFILTAGTITFGYADAPQNLTVTGIKVCSGSAASSAPTLVRLGLYSIDASGNLTLLAQTANVAASALIAANTLYTVPFDSSVASSATLTRGQRYAVALLSVGGTAPRVRGITFASSALTNVAPILAKSLATQTDLPASATSASLGSSTTVPWCSAQ